MTKLDELRTEITAVDDQLVPLLEKRMGISEAIAAYKKEHGKAIFDASREEDVIKNAVDRLKNQGYSEFIEAIYQELMKVSKDLQQKKIDSKD